MTGCGHESLSIFVHYVPNLLSVRYPDSRFAPLTALRLAQTPHLPQGRC